MFIMFAIIGAEIDAGLLYWICYAIWCLIKVDNALSK